MYIYGNTMSILINDDKLEDGLQDIADDQATKTSKRAMAYAILQEACDSFKKTGDALGWKKKKKK